MTDDTKTGEVYAMQKEKGWTSMDYKRKAREWALSLSEWPLVMNTTQLAGILNVSVGTVSGWRKKGVGPEWFAFNGKRPMYRKEDVLVWLEKSKEGNQEYRDRVARNGRMTGANNLKPVNIKTGEKMDTMKKVQTMPAHLVFRK